MLNNFACLVVPNDCWDLVEAALLEYLPWLLWQEVPVHDWGEGERAKADHRGVDVVDGSDFLGRFLQKIIALNVARSREKEFLFLSF